MVFILKNGAMSHVFHSTDYRFHRSLLLLLFNYYVHDSRLSGTSPFMGDDPQETISNVTKAVWDFDDEAFEGISADAKDFISKLMIKRPRFVTTFCKVCPLGRYGTKSQFRLVNCK